MSGQAGISGDAGMGQGGVADVREPSAKYLIDSERKETVLGKIPVDWVTKTIGETFVLINGCAFKPSDWKQSGLPIIRIQNLNDPEAEFNYSQLPPADRNIVESGDLLFAWSGTIGSSFGARLWHGHRGVLNQHIFKVLMDTSKMSKSFALLVFARVEQDIAREAHGFKASFVHVKKSDLQKVNLPIPPLAEQRAIATALSDVDALIAGLERLIAKKRDIKQAAMQQLLTGQTRLPGFSGDWTAAPIGEQIDLLTGFPFASDQYTSSGVRLLRGSNVKRGKTDWSDDLVQHWPKLTPEIAKYELQVGDLVIAMDGSLVGRSYARLEESDMPALLLQRVARIRSKTLDIGFLCQLIGSDQFIKYCDSVKTVTAIPHISSSDINGYSIRIPPSLDEQTAIATVLADMDADLTALESRLAKTRAIKQGMMQELLTGRTRLI